MGACRPTDAVPPVDASDLVSYLVLQTSFLTAKQFKAHKGLESYNQFVCGWVKEVRTWKKFVTTGHVLAQPLLAHLHTCTCYYGLAGPGLVNLRITAPENINSKLA